MGDGLSLYARQAPPEPDGDGNNWRMVHIFHKMLLSIMPVVQVAYTYGENLQPPRHIQHRHNALRYPHDCVQHFQLYSPYNSIPHLLIANITQHTYQDCSSPTTSCERNWGGLMWHSLSTSILSRCNRWPDKLA